MRDIADLRLSNILLSVDDDGIARVTLNRPARLNAIDDKMPREIRRAVEAANDDDKVHVIVLAGYAATQSASTFQRGRRIAAQSSAGSSAERPVPAGASSDS